MSGYDDIFEGGFPSLPTASGPSPSAYDDIFGDGMPPSLDAAVDRSYLDDALHGFGTVAGGLASGKDAVMRGLAGTLGLDLPETATEGSVLRTAMGFDPGQDANQGYATHLIGRGIEEITNLGTDPLLPLLGPLGEAATGGRVAGRVLAREGLDLAPEILRALQGAEATGKIATPISRAASAAFTGLMAAGTVEQAHAAHQQFLQSGADPQFAEDALGTVLSGLFTAGGALHLGHELVGQRPVQPRTLAEEAPTVPAAFPEAPPPAYPFPEHEPGASIADIPARRAPADPGGFDPASGYGEIPAWPEPGREVNLAAERAFLTPDAEAGVNAQQAQLARAHLERMRALGWRGGPAPEPVAEGAVPNVWPGDIPYGFEEATVTRSPQEVMLDLIEQRQRTNEARAAAERAAAAPPPTPAADQLLQAQPAGEAPLFPAETTQVPLTPIEAAPPAVPEAPAPFPAAAMAPPEPVMAPEPPPVAVEAAPPPPVAAAPLVAPPAPVVEAPPAPPPPFNDWVRQRLGGRDMPPTGEGSMFRGLRDEYLAAFPEADREQFRPGKGPIQPAFEAPAEPPPVDVEASQATAAAEAQRIVPDANLDQELAGLADTLETANLNKAAVRGQFMSESGLSGLNVDKKQIIRAIRRGGDDPLYQQIRERVRTAMADRAVRQPAAALPEEAPFDVDSTDRGAERRGPAVPAEVERRLAQRRAEIAAEYGREEGDPLVARITLEEQARQKAEAIAARDPMTGLESEYAWEDALPKHTGGFGSLDVSGLSWVNDNLGHPSGDVFLKAAAEAMRRATAEVPGARAFRYGGDEFSILAGDKATADQIGLRSQQLFRDSIYSFEKPDGTVVRYTGGRIDYGGAEGVGKKGFRRSDDTLYADRELAKQRGERALVKGQRPPGLRELPPEGVEAHLDRAAEGVAPPPAAAAAGVPKTFKEYAQATTGRWPIEKGPEFDRLKAEFDAAHPSKPKAPPKPEPPPPPSPVAKRAAKLSDAALAKLVEERRAANDHEGFTAARAEQQRRAGKTEPPKYSTKPKDGPPNPDRLTGEVLSKMSRRLKAQEKATAQAPTDLRQAIHQRFGELATLATEKDGKIRVKFTDGRGDYVIDPGAGEIAYEPGSFKAGRGRELGAAEQIVGSFQKVGIDGFLKLREGIADGATLGHEELHGLLALGRLRPGEIEGLWKEHGWDPREHATPEAKRQAFAEAEERVADTVGNLINERLKAERAGKKVQQPGWFDRLWKYVSRLWDAFKGYEGDTAETAKERIASGEVYQKPGIGERAAAATGNVLRDIQNSRPRGGDITPIREGDAYATARPGQRGLEGIGEDVASEKAKPKGPEQTSMFTGEMLQPTEAKVTEGREADGPLFKQDEAARARAEEKAQGGIKFATAPATPPGMPPPKAGPKAVPPPAGKPSTSFDIPAETRGEAVSRIFQDSMRRLRTVRDAIAVQGGKLKADPVMAAEMKSGLTAARVEEIRQKYAEPLAQELSKSGVTVDQLDQYLKANDAAKRNQVLKDRSDVDNGSGWDDAKAQKVMADLKAKGLEPKLKAAAQRVYDALDEGLKIAVRDDLLSQEQADGLRDTWGKSYVPWKSLEAEEGHGGHGFGMGGKGFDLLGKEYKQAHGRSSEAFSPTANAFAQLERTIARAERNRVTKEFATFVKDNPDRGLWQIDAEHKNRDGTPDHAAYQDDLHYKEGGETKRITIEDPLLRRAMKNMGAMETNKALQYASRATRLYSKMVTTMSPEFIFRNLTRDLQDAVANLGAERGGKIAAKAATGVPQAVKAMWRVTKDPAAKGKWEDYAREFKKNGGPLGWSSTRTANEVFSDLTGDVKAAGPGLLRAGQRAYRGIGRLINDANGAVENGTRLSTFVALREAGVPVREAIAASKNVTVNFEKHGEAGPFLNSLFAFFNANVQGAKRLKEVVIDSPRGRAIAAGIVSAGAAMDAYNRAQSTDSDEDGTNDYDAIPEYVKARNFVFMRGPGQAPLTFPMPYGFGLIYSAGRLGMAAGSGATSAPKAAGTLLSATVNAFNPLGAEIFDEKGFSGSGLIESLTPTAIDPIVEHAMNKDWRGRPIKPEGYPGAAEKPGSEQYFKNVSPIARKVTDFLNESTGGDHVSPGFISWSPEVVQHYADFALGGLGRFLGNTAATVESLKEGETPATRKIPFLRSFLYEASPGQQGQTFRENIQELETLDHRYKTYRKEGDSEKAAEIPRELLRAKQKVDSIENRIRALRRGAATIPDVEAKIADLQKQANRIVADARRAS